MSNDSLLFRAKAAIIIAGAALIMDHGPQLCRPCLERQGLWSSAAPLVVPEMEINMSVSNTAESFPDMLRRMLGDRLRPDAETFPDMFAVDGVLEYPFAPAGLNTLFAGRDAIIANFQRIRKLMRVDSVANVSEIQGSDPNVAVLEFTGKGEGLTTGEVYDQRYISVIHMRDGSIVHYKDYWNPIAVVRAIKGSESAKVLAID